MLRSGWFLIALVVGSSVGSRFGLSGIVGEFLLQLVGLTNGSVCILKLTVSMTICIKL